MNLIGLSEFLSQYDSPETARAYNRDILRFFSFIEKDPDEVTRIDVIGYLNLLKSLELSSSSVRRMIYSIKSYMNFLTESDIIKKNPVVGIKLPKKKFKYDKGLSDDEIKKMFIFLQTWRGDRELSIFMFLLYNGLRRSEICNLNYEDVKQIDGQIVLEVKGKGDKIRIRPLHKKSSEYLARYLKSEDRSKGKHGDPIFTTPSGKRMYPQYIYRFIRRAGVKAGIKDRAVHPHMLRAKFASMAIEAGVPITSLQEDMGHSSVETTAMYDKAKRSIERSGVLLIPSIHGE